MAGSVREYTATNIFTGEEIVGSKKELCEKLNIGMNTLDRYIYGFQKSSKYIFKINEVVIEKKNNETWFKKFAEEWEIARSVLRRETNNENIR